MKIKEDFDINLLKNYGFHKPIDYNTISYDIEDYTISNSDYILYLGHSRRGQFYYLLVKDKDLYIYSSKPDGDGGKLLLPDVLLKLFNDGIIT